MSGSGHPLPASREARHSEIPEHLEREKGRGDDFMGIVQPQAEAVTPGGEPYRYDDLGRGPETVAGGSKEEDMAEERDQSSGERFDEAQGSGRGPEPEEGDEFAADQAEHQDRGQGVAETESGGR